MKRIEATIDPTELDEVWETLSEAGVEGMTVLDVRTFDRRSATRKVYFGAACVEDSALKQQITVVVVDAQASAVLEALQPFDSAVLVTEVVEAVRIRTDERGNDAVSSRSAFRPRELSTRQEDHAPQEPLHRTTSP
jgi:nitrogen regulatory protein P-II 1